MYAMMQMYFMSNIGGDQFQEFLAMKAEKAKIDGQLALAKKKVLLAPFQPGIAGMYCFDKN